MTDGSRWLFQEIKLIGMHSAFICPNLSVSKDDGGKAIKEER